MSILCSIVLCAALPTQADAAPRFFQRVEDAFAGVSRTHRFKPFDVVAADMDRDGDPDLLINWHNRDRMELFENREGTFRLVNPSGKDESGLYENPYTSDLYVPFARHAPAVRASGPEGLHVWHDLARGGSWRFLWKDPKHRLGGFRLGLATTFRVKAVTGLSPEQHEVVDAGRSRITVDGAATDLAFSVDIGGGVLELQLAPLSGESRPPWFFGRDSTPCAEAEVRIWRSDPHGLAWVDVEGSSRPELFVTRGALVGRLAPPMTPKADLFYVASAEPPFQLSASGLVPAGYARGRSVTWVDVDGDGVLELSLGNEASPNSVFAREPETGAFRDMAPALGLDFEGAEVQCWGDYDRDGRQDMFFLAGDRIDVARNVGKGRFERIDGRTLGLALTSEDSSGRAPGSPSERESEGDETEAGDLFDRTALRLADFDCDGDLDLWLLGYAEAPNSEPRCRLFRREPSGFKDVSESTGLSALAGHTFVLIDVDSDGFEDVVAFATRAGERDLRVKVGSARLARNRGGESFEVLSLPPTLVPEHVLAATALDADGDGRTDLALVGRERHLLRNVHATKNRSVAILPRGDREPVGAEVRVLLANGRSIVRRYGSASNSAFSQTLQPLVFGIPADTQLTGVAVRWPGHTEEVVYPITVTGRTHEVRER